MLEGTELGTKIGRISEQMPSDWTYAVVHHEYGNDMHFLENENGATLHCYAPYPHHRLSISGTFPRTPDQTFYPRDGKYSITVNPERDNLAIAKDICRRLVPDYLIAYAKSVEQMNAYLAKQQEQAVIIDTLADALGANVSPGHDEIYIPNTIKAHGTFRVSLSGSIEIRRLSDITLDQALQICAILSVDKRETAG